MDKLIKNSATDHKGLLLLKETADFAYNPVKSEECKNGEIVVTGVIQRANAKNHNGRVYTKEILFPKIQKYIDEKVKLKKAYGELDHVDNTTVEFERVSHIFDDIWFEGDDVMGRVRILPTPKGNILKVFFDCGTTVGISSRAIGSVEQHSGANFVQDDLHIICWDFVTEPSTHGANMFKEAREITEAELKKVLSREEFIQDRIKRYLSGF